MLGPSAALSGFEYKVDFLKVKAGAELISMAGYSLSATERAIRRFSSEEIIFHRDERGGGTNAHRLYAPSDIAVGAIAFALTSDMGVQDRDALRAVATELYRLDGGAHAITRALAALRDGEERVCLISVFKNASEERQFRVALLAPDAPILAEGFRSGIVINLSVLLGPLIEWLEADALSETELNPPKAN